MSKLTLIFIFISTLIVVIPTASPCAAKGIVLVVRVLRWGLGMIKSSTRMDLGMSRMAMRPRIRLRTGYWRLPGQKWAKFTAVPRAIVRRAGRLGKKVLDEFILNIADQAGRELVQSFIQEDCPAAMEEVHRNDKAVIVDD